MNPNSFLYNLVCERRAALEKVRAIIKPLVGTDPSILPVLKVLEDVNALWIVAVEEIARLKPRWNGDIRHPSVPIEPVVPSGMCVICRTRPDVDKKPCYYGLPHEVFQLPAPIVQTKRIDTKICTKCKLHQKNPASATNGCEHTYPEAP